MADTDHEEELAFSSYWDARYNAALKASTSDTTSSSQQIAASHEWFRNFEQIRPFLESQILPQNKDKADLKILHLGCGDSTVPTDLYSCGYKNQICIDFSEVIITEMRKRNELRAPEIQWITGDICNMPQIQSESIDLVLDKGTLDALISGSMWDPPEKVKEMTAKYIDEVVRVLKVGGRYTWITFRQPHFMKRHVEREGVWTLKVHDMGGEDGSFGYFAYVLDK